MNSHEPISRVKAFFLANIMLVIYCSCLAVSISAAMAIGHYTLNFSTAQFSYRTLLQYGLYFDIPVTLFLIITILSYERPIRHTIKDLYCGQLTDASTIVSARRRLLNEPFMLMALNACSWIGAAVVFYFLARWVLIRPELAILFTVNCLLIAVISTLTTFFFLQYGIQRWLAPVLFPEGGLASVPGTLRMTLATRLAALIAAVCLSPLFIIGVTLYGAEYQRLYGARTDEVFDRLASTLTFELVLFSVLAAIVTYLVAVNLSRPFYEIIAVLHQIKNGKFNRRVRVATNDELGYTGDAINEMNQGLKERERMQRSLSLAREVQQNLLPASAPHVKGLEISGTSVYCDETGGDYFDYIELDRDGSQRLALVIGDVSGHGVPAALLMTSTRACLRFRTSLPGKGDEIVGHLNRQFCLDTSESGQFLTLFYLEVDPRSWAMEWVRAGHEPAYLYKPDQDRFETLKGSGAALGLDQGIQYTLNCARAGKGEILVLTTDGIFEARSHAGMFGKQRFMETIRRHKNRTAKGIRDAVLQAVDDFRGQTPQEDDVTLIVIKFIGTTD